MDTAAVPAPPATAPLLRVRDLRKGFFGVPVLRGVDLDLHAGQVLGLVGENGAGKSTLMNLLGGVLQPDGGTLELGGAAYAPGSPAGARAAGIAFIHQELNLFGNLSVAENVFLGDLPRRSRLLPVIDRRAMRARARVLLQSVGLEVSPDAKLGDLSPGERQLVEIAKALSVDARIVIFDEPTTSLTVREAERLFALIEKLRGEGRAIVYISHALGDVLRLCDRIVVLRDGAVVDADARAAFTVERMVRAMVGRSLDRLFPPRAHAVGEAIRLRVRGLTRAGMIKDVSFELRAGEILGVAGLMGAGRSELARILFGLEPSDHGTVELDGQALTDRSPERCLGAGMAFLTEDRRHEGLLLDSGVRDNIALAALRGFARGRVGPVATGRLQVRADAVARSVGIAEAKLAGQPVRTLSGGNQQKVVLAKWLLTGPRLFILDEPTRGVDVGARYEIYERIHALAASGAGVLLISSELEELLGMSDRILVMCKGEVAGMVAREDFDREHLLRLAFGGSA